MNLIVILFCLFDYAREIAERVRNDYAVSSVDV